MFGNIIKTIILICVILPGSAYCEQPEGIKRTIDFIQKKTTIQRPCGIMYCLQRLSFDESGCKVVAKQVYSEERFGKTKLIFIGKANLKDMNPSLIEAEENEIRLHTTNGKPTVINSQNGVTEAGSTFYIFTDKPQDVKQVIEAFRFLIKICGGQGDIF